MAISSISQKNDAYSRLGFIRRVPSDAAMKSRKNTYSAESVVVDEITQANIGKHVPRGWRNACPLPCCVYGDYYLRRENKARVSTPDPGMTQRLMHHLPF